MKLPPWLAPNRIAVYLGALVTILTGVAALLSSIGTPEAIALAAAVLGFVGLIDRFLRGWQRWEANVVAPIAVAQASVAGPQHVVSGRPALDTPDDVAVAARPSIAFPDDEQLGGWDEGDVDESSEAAQQVHLPDAGMPTSAERELQ